MIELCKTWQLLIRLGKRCCADHSSLFYREIPRPAYKPHSVSESNASARRSSLWARRYRLALAAYPKPGYARKRTRRRAASSRNAGRLLLGLAPGGGCLAAGVATCAGELLPHLFTLTSASHRKPKHCVSVARSGRLLLPGGYPAPCSIECGLSSTRCSTPRSPDQPGDINHTIEQ